MGVKRRILRLQYGCVGRRRGDVAQAKEGRAECRRRLPTGAGERKGRRVSGDSHVNCCTESGLVLRRDGCLGSFESNNLI